MPKSVNSRPGYPVWALYSGKSEQQERSMGYTLGTCIGAIHPKFPQPIGFPSEKKQLCMSEQLAQRLRTCSAEGVPLRRGFPDYPRPAVFPSQNACKVYWAQLCLRHRPLAQLLILRVAVWGGESIHSRVRVTYMAPLPPILIAKTDNINEYFLFSAELTYGLKILLHSN